jgi:hypothetical protein
MPMDILTEFWRVTFIALITLTGTVGVRYCQILCPGILD